MNLVLRPKFRIQKSKEKCVSNLTRFLSLRFQPARELFMSRHDPFPYSTISSLLTPSNHPSPIPQLTSTQLAWRPITTSRSCFTDVPQAHSKAQCRVLCGKRPQILNCYYCNAYNVGITECDLDNWVFCGGFIQCGFLKKHLWGAVEVQA
jgi:hypothetical protein